MNVSCFNSSNEQLIANNRINTIDNLISSIPHIYYDNISEEIVVDKCRSWTLEPNIELLKKYVDKNIKIIVLIRSVLDIVKSFMNLYEKNNIYNVNVEDKLLKPNSEPIMRSLNGIFYAKNNNKNNNFLFIHYNDLTTNTKETIKKIYDFCSWEYFEHDFQNIVTKYPENDQIYGLKEMHTVYPTIKLEQKNIKLSKKIINKCKDLDNKYIFN
jgi:hypothetical protein